MSKAPRTESKASVGQTLVVKVTGPAGSGKSTLLRMIARELGARGATCDVLDEGGKHVLIVENTPRLAPQDGIGDAGKMPIVEEPGRQA